MFKIYKAEKINLGEPKAIKHADIKLVKNIKEQKNGKNARNDENQIAKDIINEAKALYADIVDEANLEASKIIENAEDNIRIEKEREIKRAYEEGFEKGYSEGKVKAEVIINQAKLIKDFLEKRKEEVHTELEVDIINLVIEVSKKLLGKELEENNEVIIFLIKEAMKKSAYKERISIRISSDDYIYVLENKETIKSLVEGVKEIDIVEDKYLEKGDCIVDTPGGQINTSLKLQMKELEEAFLYILRNE